jgi:serine protease
VVVVAAGNSNTDAATASPANCSNVISVAAVGRDGSRAAYSNFSSPATNTTNPLKVTLAAQGGDTSLGAAFDPGINSTINSGTTIAASAAYAYKQGTSMATPHVAAAAALMLSRNASLTPVQIKTILSASATTFPSFSTTGWAPYDCATLQNCGAGILNANNALVASITPFTSTTQTINFGTVTTSDPVSQSITLNNGTASAITLGATTFTGENTTSFSITGNTCSGSIAAGASCQISVTFAPKAVNINSAGIFIPAQPATLGAITIGLTGVASLPATAGSALSATKSSNGNSSGGCSIMPQGNHSDFSLLLAVLVILLFSFRQHLAIGKQA